MITVETIESVLRRQAGAIEHPAVYSVVFDARVPGVYISFKPDVSREGFDSAALAQRIADDLRRHGMNPVRLTFFADTLQTPLVLPQRGKSP